MSIKRMDSLRITSQLQSEWQSSVLSFRIMLVGESGLGKSTFTRALLRPYVPDHMLHTANPEPICARTVEITEIVHRVDNEGYPVEFTIVDCPGYGDAIDCTPWINEITSYVTSKFATHFDEAGSPPRQPERPGNDGLVHVCLYFITAHRLKGQDVEFMRRLEPHVNLVPVIAKADTMTLGERDAFRRQVLAELDAANVKIFDLDDAVGNAADAAGGLAKAAPPLAGDERPFDPIAASPGAMSPGPGLGPGGPTAARPVCTTRPPPFAVCASEDGTRVYPWGTCYVEDPNHSDLSTLRSMLFASSMLKAKRRTMQLFEDTYASPRRAAEQEAQAAQVRAVRRARVIEGLACAFGALALATASAAAARPGVIANATDALSGPVRSVLGKAGTALATVATRAGGAVAQRARGA